MTVRGQKQRKQRKQGRNNEQLQNFSMLAIAVAAGAFIARNRNKGNDNNEAIQQNLQKIEALQTGGRQRGSASVRPLYNTYSSTAGYSNNSTVDLNSGNYKMMWKALELIPKESSNSILPSAQLQEVGEIFETKDYGVVTTSATLQPHIYANSGTTTGLGSIVWNIENATGHLASYTHCQIDYDQVIITLNDGTKSKSRKLKFYNSGDSSVAAKYMYYNVEDRGNQGVNAYFDTSK